MKDIWFTADLHLGHKNIIEYCNRPFDGVDSMNTTIINNWNECVQDDDDVYVLGDFTLLSHHWAAKYIDELHGNIHFIPGSHDAWMDKKNMFMSDRVNFLPPLYSFTWKDAIFVLCHYALRVWDRSHYGAYHLYGHSHGRLLPLGRSMDVGVDAQKFFPIHIERVVSYLEVIEPHNKKESA